MRPVKIYRQVFRNHYDEHPDRVWRGAARWLARHKLLEQVVNIVEFVDQRTVLIVVYYRAVKPIGSGRAIVCSTSWVKERRANKGKAPRPNVYQMPDYYPSYGC